MVWQRATDSSLGLSRCSATIKPLLLQVTVPYGKSLGRLSKKIEKNENEGEKRFALAALDARTLGRKKFYFFRGGGTQVATHA
jgi:hypothetical protein